jgi:cellulose synthase/poly-beta-1,6-N-acetylglucosamine synthase-like glycosyltransferase
VFDATGATAVPVEVVFWAAAGLILYTWFGYPALLVVFGRAQPVRSHESGGLPSVSVLVTVHNGARVIASKLENIMSLDYPPDRLQVIVVSDGSTDATEQIVARLGSRVELVAISDQVGKTAAQNRGIERCAGEILVLTDADTALAADSLRRLVAHFADPLVGAVAPLVVWTDEGANALTAAGDIYWRFEQLLWERESRLGLLACAPGACLVVRRTLVSWMNELFGDDVVIPLEVVAAGRKIAYDPVARVYDHRSASVAGEFTSRVRMTMRSWAATVSTWGPRRWLEYPALTWAIFSHKILRWSTPYLGAVSLVASAILAARPVYAAVLLLQICFLAAALAGRLMAGTAAERLGLGAAYSFAVVNAAFAVGVFNAVVGRRKAIYVSID